VNSRSLPLHYTFYQIGVSMTESGIIALITGVTALIAALGLVIKNLIEAKSIARAALEAARVASETAANTQNIAATKADMEAAQVLIAALQADNKWLRAELRAVEEHHNKQVVEYELILSSLRQEVNRLTLVMLSHGIDPTQSSQPVKASESERA